MRITMTTIPVKPLIEPIVEPQVKEPEPSRVLEPDKLCPNQGDEIVRRVEEDV